MLSSAPTPIIALPSVAPIPVPMILHSLGYTAEAFATTYLQILNDAFRYQKPLEQYELFRMYKHLDFKLQKARKDIYHLMSHEIEERQKISIKWFRKTLAETINQKPLLRESATEKREYSASNTTLLAWKEKAVLLPEKPRDLDYDRVAAILMMAMVDERKQGFLPSWIDPGEPHTWCYVRVSPEAAILPCPLPPPLALPRGAILFSSWPTFDDEWLLLREPGEQNVPFSLSMPIGTMRFASYDFPSLAQWDERLKSREVQLIFGGHKELDYEARRILYSLAPHFLSSAIFPPELPLVYDSQLLISALTRPS